jgi:hypothetical protein
MNFFATSLQIASDWDTDHNDVLKIIDKMPHEKFKEENIQVFEANNFRLAQMTEFGYNAVVFYLPLEEHNRDNLLLFRERLFKNRSPVNSASTATTPSATPGESVKTPGSSVNDEARKEAYRMVTAGECDDLARGSFKDLHLHLKEKLGGDPGYQNCRNYMTRRKAVLGIKD